MSWSLLIIHSLSTFIDQGSVGLLTIGTMPMTSTITVKNGLFRDASDQCGHSETQLKL